MTLDTASLGKMIEEALNDDDDTELMSVINSFTPEQWAAIAKALQNEANARRTKQ